MNQDGVKPDLAVIGVFVIALAAIFYVFSGDNTTPLRRSAVGFDGLATWLRDQDISARSFRGGYTIRREGVGLRVLPIYDTDLSTDRSEPETEQELLFQQDERDLNIGFVRQKVVQTTTMIILPKWRSGARLVRVAYPLLLGDIAATNRIAEQIQVGLGALITPANFNERFEYQSQTGKRLQAVLYAPQLFTSEGCEPIIGSAERILLGKCQWNGVDDRPVYVLTDPDLFSNHGLALGDNAKIAADLFAELAGDKEVVVDYSTDLWLIGNRTGPPRPERTWSDLGQYFQPPFTALWVSFVLALALTLWRSWVRFGVAAPSTEGAPSAAKQAAIEAKARLLRLGGHDQALMSARIEQRLSAVVLDIFGPHAPAGRQPLDVICAFLQRRGASEAADRLSEAAKTTRPGAPADALQRLRNFEAILNEVQREFGRTSGRG